MRTLFVSLGLLILLFTFSCTPAPAPQPEPEQTAVNESGQPLAATSAIITQDAFVGLHLVTQSGGMKTTDALWVQTRAFMPVPAGQVYDPELFMRDIIKALTDAGKLNGINLQETAKNYLIIISSSAAFKKGTITDSRNLNKSKPVTG
jgi:hypothetical protein